ncbi:hypothetical protein PBI_NESBITT_32 [Streptomyces phage Nesbitt]|uniref:Uncharacterized protein n=1 Tax=Streptomyces phage Nesbitt TaxID=2108133 RepID=A0A2P1JT16_9CAUD|nr:hypothetical protein PBI_NESBITT_32 [Streptomyces phage Nesbitt]
MAFYLVSNPANQEGTNGEFLGAVVRASGRVQARKLVLAANPAETSTSLVVTKLEDGRNVDNGVILSEYADDSGDE